MIARRVTIETVPVFEENMADEEDTKAEQEVEEAINPDDNEEGNDDQKKEVDLEDPYIGAIDYLEKHHIVDLFQV